MSAARSSELVAFRLSRAYESLEDARILGDAGRWNACVNRLYYACFYAVTALLIQQELSSSKHTGVRALFNQNFVKPGIVSKDDARIYNDLFERRQQGDYADFKRFEETQVRPWISDATLFLESIKTLVDHTTR